MLKRLLVSVVVIASLVAISIVGCAPKPPAEKQLNLGNIGPLTGPAAPWGVPIARGLECLAEYYNEQGGIKADGTLWKIKMFCEDNKYLGEVGRACGEKLITKDKVKAILGDWVADSILANRSLAHKNKVFLFLGSTGAEDVILGPDWPYMFQISMTQPQKLLVFDIASEMLREKGVKLERAADINPDSTSGRGVQKGFVEEKAPEYGMEVVAALVFPPGTKDFYPFCTKILAGKPDIISMGAVGPADQALIKKTLYELGYRGYTVSAGSLVNAEGLIAIAGEEAMQGHIAPFESYECPIIKPEQREVMKAMEKKWEEKWPGEPFEPIAWRYATCLQILVQAYEKAGTLDPDVVVKTLEEGTFETILGECTFTGAERYGIAHVSSLITIAGIIEGREVKYLGYDRLIHK